MPGQLPFPRDFDMETRIAVELTRREEDLPWEDGDELLDLIYDQPPVEQPVPEPVKNIPELLSGHRVCDWTGCGLGGVLAGLGDGSPDPGVELVDGGSMFCDVGAQIAALVPDGGWQGLAAQAYVAQNLAQSHRAKMMADLDHHTAGLVSAQAQTVFNAFAWLIGEIITVATVGRGCYALEMWGGPVGQEVSLAVALVVCTAAIEVTIYLIVSLLKTTHSHANKLHALTQRLTDMLTRLPALSDPISGLPDTPLPPSHSESEFDAAEHIFSRTLAGLPDDTGFTPRTLDVPLVFADLPGSPEFSVPDVPRPGFPDFGAPDLPVPRLAGMPSRPPLPAADEFAALPDLVGALAALPSLGVTNLPTVAQPAASLSRLAGLWGAAGGFSQLTTVAGQQAHMIASLAQRVTPADHVTQDDHTTGAAAGTPTAQRVPVDAETGTSQQRQQRVGKTTNAP
ncbi:EspA/EspE family type VII secretion system effector [Mycobacterium kansasii]|uniref:EspA/EspE family type VII secretion system effector n=1 Tax=Mycobacterium kansasii TaxID=1768 RepID=UPI0015E1ED45|nr:EspA/EspE family type VII secretion system effector [Mycobacterium kansasii]